MTLNDIITTREPTKLRVIGYAKDGNTPVTHYINGYNVTGNYFVYKDKEDRYGQYNFKFVVNYPLCNYAIETYRVWYSYADDDIDWESEIKRVSVYANTEEGFVSQMDDAIANEKYIRTHEIKMLDRMFAVKPINGHSTTTAYVNHRLFIRDKMIAAERERFEAIQKKESMAFEDGIEHTKQLLLKGGDRVEVNRVYLFALAERCGCTFPPGLKGWCNKLERLIFKIENCEFKGYYYKSKSRGQAIFVYMGMLMNVLKSEQIA